MNSNLYAAQGRAQELQAEAQRDREARAARAARPERPNLLGLVKVLLLARQPRLA